MADDEQEDQVQRPPRKKGKVRLKRANDSVCRQILPLPGVRLPPFDLPQLRDRPRSGKVRSAACCKGAAACLSSHLPAAA